MPGLSVDTNIIVYSLNRDSGMYTEARAFMTEIAERDDVVMCEAEQSAVLPAADARLSRER